MSALTTSIKRDAEFQPVPSGKKKKKMTSGLERNKLSLFSTDMTIHADNQTTRTMCLARMQDIR